MKVLVAVLYLVVMLKFIIFSTSLALKNANKKYQLKHRTVFNETMLRIFSGPDLFNRIRMLSTGSISFATKIKNNLYRYCTL
jgi:hypothetical protein